MKFWLQPFWKRPVITLKCLSVYRCPMVPYINSQLMVKTPIRLLCLSFPLFRCWTKAQIKDILIESGCCFLFGNHTGMLDYQQHEYESRDDHLRSCITYVDNYALFASRSCKQTDHDILTVYVILNFSKSCIVFPCIVLEACSIHCFLYCATYCVHTFQDILFPGDWLHLSLRVDRIKVNGNGLVVIC